MPYISQELRQNTDPLIDALIQEIQKQYKEDDIEGLLNYTIMRILCNGIKPINSIWRYKYINRVTGILEQVKSEFNRRLKNPYEDRCIAKNGDLQEFKGDIV